MVLFLNSVATQHLIFNLAPWVESQKALIYVSSTLGGANTLAAVCLELTLSDSLNLLP